MFRRDFSGIIITRLKYRIIIICNKFDIFLLFTLNQALKPHTCRKLKKIDNHFHPSGLLCKYREIEVFGINRGLSPLPPVHKKCGFFRALYSAYTASDAPVWVYYYLFPITGKSIHRAALNTKAAACA